MFSDVPGVNAPSPLTQIPLPGGALQDKPNTGLLPPGHPLAAVQPPKTEANLPKPGTEPQERPQFSQPPPTTKPLGKVFGSISV